MNIGRDEILAQLDRIAKSDGFSKAEKLRGFLCLVVENSLRAEPEPLKEYAIGVKVYGRREDYDPRTDSTVRAEAVRLRNRLAQYYDGVGKDDPIRIGIAKGSYVPNFERRTQLEQASPVEAPPARRKWVVGFALVATLSAGAFFWMRSSRAPSASVAVLHFAALNAGPEMEAKAREIRTELMAALAKEPGLHLSGSEATVSGSGQPEDWAQLGARLKVRSFVEGSLRRDRDMIRLTVNLISAADGFHQWAGTFEEKGPDETAIRRQAVHAAAEELHRILQKEGSVQIERRDAAAVELYLAALRGQHVENLGRDAAMARVQRRLDLLGKCVAMDSRFAQAWGAIAANELLLGEFRQANWLEHIEKSRAAAERALAIDESQEEAHAALGGIQFLYDVKLKPAAHHLRRAVELNPRNGGSHQLYGSVLAVLGRFGEAVDEMSRAQIGAPDEAGISIGLSNVYFNWRQYQKAEAEARSALEQSAKSAEARAHWALSLALQGQGKLAEAEAEMRRALALDPKDPRATVALALLLAETHRLAEAEAVWQGGERNWKAWGGLGHTARAYLLVAKSEFSAATDELWKGYEAREGSFPYFLVDPRFDRLRGEKRFVELAQRVTEGQ